jgi:hypothetical protein
MTEAVSPSDSPEIVEVDLRDPIVAGVLAWLWPGAGHLYQRRYAKGVLFMVCILATYFFGLALADGKAVYASWTPTDKRLQYICQVCVGAPALPALVQNYRVMRGKAPLFGGIMAPPQQPVRPEGRDELALWHEHYNKRWELSTLYTLVAGLLNVLAIYDAYAGPFLPAPDEEKEKKDRPPPDQEKS